MCALKQTQPLRPNRWRFVDQKMQEYVNQGAFPGFVTLVYQNGQVVHEYCCGRMDIETGKPMQSDAIFRMYSMTKPITCTALMMLFEQGKFYLDEPVYPYIPEFKELQVFVAHDEKGMKLEPAKSPITFRQLLTHTAGLGYGILEGPVEDLFRQAKLVDWRTAIPNMALKEIIHAFAGLPLAFQPGTKFSYSCANDVIGYLISLLSDMPFDEFLQAKIFEPLGMEDTGFWVPAEKASRFVSMYEYKNEQLTLIDPPNGDFSKLPLAAMGGSGSVSTASDYLRFARMLLNGGESDGVKILSRKTVELMTANHLAPDLLPWYIFPEFPSYGVGYGLGVSVMMDRTQAGALTSNGTFGWGGAAGTNVFIDPQEQLIGLTLTQTFGITSDPLPPQSDILQRLIYQAIE